MIGNVKLSIDVQNNKGTVMHNTYVHHKEQITTSSFHDVNVLKLQTDPKKLVIRLLCSKDLSHVQAVQKGYRSQRFA